MDGAACETSPQPLSQGRGARRDGTVPSPLGEGRGRGFVLLALLASACTVGPRYEPPAPPTPSAFKEAIDAGPPPDGGAVWSPANPKDTTPRGAWWEVYGSPELDRLEAQLEINNETLKQAFENFMAARAVVAQARAQYYPTVSVGLGFTEARTSANVSSGVSSVPPPTFAPLPSATPPRWPAAARSSGQSGADGQSKPSDGSLNARSSAARTRSRAKPRSSHRNETMPSKSGSV